MRKVVFLCFLQNRTLFRTWGAAGKKDKLQVLAELENCTEEEHSVTVPDCNPWVCSLQHPQCVHNECMGRCVCTGAVPATAGSCVLWPWCYKACDLLCSVLCRSTGFAVPAGSNRRAELSSARSLKENIMSPNVPRTSRLFLQSLNMFIIGQMGIQCSAAAQAPLTCPSV